MIGRSHFVHKFKNSTVFLPISYNERAKDVLFERPGTVLIHCVTTTEEPYMFTICVEYSKSPFDLIVFLKSLENSEYVPLMKEIEDQVDKKEWLNKEGLPLGAKGMASRVSVVYCDVTERNRVAMSRHRHNVASRHYDGSRRCCYSGVISHRKFFLHPPGVRHVGC
jgi:hypothetical protein